MNTRTAAILARKLMKEHGLKDKGWTFQYDTAKKRFGCCFYGLKRITLSKELTRVNPEERVRNTILHEIAHALAGNKAGHNKKWRDIAISIGCDGKRLYSPVNTKLAQCKYVGKCPKGHISMKTRLTTWRSYSCGQCDPSSFNRDYLVTYKLNPKYK